jgi:hypothetical protein
MGLAGLGLLIVIVWMTPHWVLLARNLAFPLQSTEQSETHGMSHSLYIGLGVKPNSFGIRWDDASAAEAVQAVAPQVAYTSNEYYRILWTLYLTKIRDHPAEVARIYWNKAWGLLDRSALWAYGSRPPRWAPRLWLVLPATIWMLVAARKRGAWRRYSFEPGFLLGVIALGFVSLFIVQGMLVNPSLQYGAPVGLFVVLLAGVAVELFCRSQWIRPSAEGDTPLALGNQGSK